MCFRRSSQHLFSHSFVRASLNMHGVWSRAGASGTPQTAQAGPARYDAAQLSLPSAPRLPHLVLNPYHPDSISTCSRGSRGSCLVCPAAWLAHGRLIHHVARPRRASLSLAFVLIRDDSPSCFGDEIPPAAAHLGLNFTSDVTDCPQEMKTQNVGPLRTRDGQREGRAGL